ncbi:MAG: BrnA antitoxin family protein [Rhodoferax sp.]
MYDDKLKPHPDPEVREFEEALLRSVGEAKAGVFAAVHTPEQIIARRRGRPAGSVQAVTKVPVKIRLDADVLLALRASGDGWQTRINDTLRASLHLAGRV